MRDDEFCDVVIGEGLARKPGRLLYFLRSIFRGVPLEQARMLEIGSGAGVPSLWAAHCGAKRVICLEPEQAGSTTGAAAKFHRMCDRLGLGGIVSLVPQRVQDYDPQDEQFDVILLHDSVNHLDENACAHLHETEPHRAVYRNLFAKIAAWAVPGARLILTDCSRQNFFPGIGRMNPLARDIAWEKHQAPEVWVGVLAESGFGEAKVNWTSYNSLRTLGRLLLGNRVAAYFLRSHFRLVMTRT